MGNMKKYNEGSVKTRSINKLLMSDCTTEATRVGESREGEREGGSPLEYGREILVVGKDVKIKISRG